MSQCNCRVGGGIKATNEIGMEVQEFALPQGWVAPEHLKFATCCEATAALAACPNDGVERRIYPTLVIKERK